MSTKGLINVRMKADGRLSETQMDVRMRPDGRLERY